MFILMLGMVGKMWMLSGLAPMQQYQDAWSVFKCFPVNQWKHLFPVLTEKAALTYVVWSKEQFWFIVLIYAMVIKYKAA